MATRRKKPPFTAAQARWITEELEHFFLEGSVEQVIRNRVDDACGPATVAKVTAEMLADLFLTGLVRMPPWPKEHGNDLAVLAEVVNKLITQRKAEMVERPFVPKGRYPDVIQAEGARDLAFDPAAKGWLPKPDTDYNDEFRAEVEKDLGSVREVPGFLRCDSVTRIDTSDRGTILCGQPAGHSGMHRRRVHGYRPGLDLLVAWTDKGYQRVTHDGVGDLPFRAPENAMLPIVGPADPWEHRAKGMKCATCMWWVAKLPSGAAVTPEDEKIPAPDARGPLGRCRRHAPTMAGYPAVFATDWCGDHKLDETKL